MLAHSPLIDTLQRLRRTFTDNHFLGWLAWFQVFQQELQAASHGACGALLGELRLESYALSPNASWRLAQLQDLVDYQRGGETAVYYARKAEAGSAPHAPAQALAALRLGLVYQHQKLYEDAEASYNKGLELAAGVDWLRVQANFALVALKQSHLSGTPHQHFVAEWKAVTASGLDARAEFLKLVEQALHQDPWPRGREAVTALVREGAWDKVADWGLHSPHAPVRRSALAALRQKKGGFTAALVEALQDEDDWVRWQAAMALRLAAAPDAAPALVKALQTDADVHVRMAAAEGLGRLGDRSHIATLQAVRPAGAVSFKGRGDTLEASIRQAVTSIEARHPVVVTPVQPLKPARPPVPRRSQAVARAYWAVSLAVDALLLALGALVASWAGLAVAAGYALYGLAVKGGLELALGQVNFYAGKPCYTNLPPRRAPHAFWGSSWLQAAEGVMHIFPIGVYLLGLLREFNWLWLAVPVIWLVLLFVKYDHRADQACRYCPVQAQCRLWQTTLKQMAELREVWRSS